MADIITRCIKTSDENNHAIQWDVSYKVEQNGYTNDFCVTILALDLIDPDSSTEAKEKANLRAKAIKDAWIERSMTSSAAVPSVLGTVTL